MIDLPNLITLKAVFHFFKGLYFKIIFHKKRKISIKKRILRFSKKHYVRTPLTTSISRDEGETWENERIIAGDPYGDFGYPSVHHLNDLVLLSYHALDGLHLARIKPGWFYERDSQRDAGQKRLC